MTKPGINYAAYLSEAGKSLAPNAIRTLSTLLVSPEIISFVGGAPSPEVFPIEELADIAARVIRERGQFALQYGATRGSGKLLDVVAGIMHQRRIEANSRDRLIITTGSQQGLDLAARIILDPGDVVMVELPSYVGGTVALQNTGAELAGVKQDDGGMIIDDLRSRLDHFKSKGRRVKCIYTIPNFQNPSGVTLAADRREGLIAVAEEYNLLIIEDDPYYELYYTEAAPNLAPLAALAPDRVIYLSSFSKILTPGLRIAWLSAPAEIAAKVELAKVAADLSSSQLDMAIVYEAARTGVIERGLPRLRRFYADHCQAMLEALEQNAAKSARWTRPLGGFFILLETHDGIDTAELLPKAMEAGVAYVPGQPFFADSSGANTMRLAFSK
ncbi:MAG TPA: PLP-dependent aminotransferase family protein, partial [Blastocatellia bacterium]|nr:PLP-dependent aminotransferase family protein [Blastocatellia bacterium]